MTLRDDVIEAMKCLDSRSDEERISYLTETDRKEKSYHQGLSVAYRVSADQLRECLKTHRKRG